MNFPLGCASRTTNCCAAIVAAKCQRPGRVKRLSSLCDQRCEANGAELHAWSYGNRACTLVERRCPRQPETRGSLLDLKGKHDGRSRGRSPPRRSLLSRIAVRAPDQPRVVGAADRSNRVRHQLEGHGAKRGSIAASSGRHAGDARWLDALRLFCSGCEESCGERVRVGFSLVAQHDN